MKLETRKPTARGPVEWFTGEVWIDAVAQGQGATPMTVGSVHFTPGARTAWHRHGVGQALYVTEGEGLVQSRGEGVVAIRAGDVAVIPAGEWHWHGAAPDHVLTHLAITEGETEWAQHVTDAEYGGDAAGNQ